MPDRIDAAHEWMRRHHGVIARGDLLRLGFSPAQANGFVEASRLVPLHRGIYRSPAHPDTPHQRMVAACRLHPMVAVSFTTGGREWGWRRMGRDREVHVLGPHTVKLRLDGVRFHRTRVLDRVDVTTTRDDGIRLASPPRTLLDAASMIGADATASVVEQLLADDTCTLGTLLATSRRLGHPARPGARVFSQVLLSRPAWRGAARSELEIRMREAVARAGLPEPKSNMPFVLPDGATIEIDLAFVDERVAVEVDHPFWHAGAEEVRRDTRRDRRLAAAGWLPQRVVEADIDADVDGVAAELRDVLRTRGWRPGRAA